MAESFFGSVEFGPKDAILGIAEAHNADKNPIKINVGVGAYRDDNGKPYILPCVAKAEEIISKTDRGHEYLPIEGSAQFRKLATELAYGLDSIPFKEDRILSVQALSGTGSLRLVAGILARFLRRADGDNTPQVRVSDPTWANHYQIFQDAGMTVGSYKYWDPKTKGLDFDGLIADFKAMTPHTVVILHACAHNPTGVDPNTEQWKKISQVCLEQKLFVLFDAAYHGMATGDLDKDIEAVRIFVQDGHHIALCQSFAKNFGLYGERVGNASIVCKDTDERDRLMSQAKIVSRSLWSNPPLYGSKIVTTVLSSDELRQQWLNDIDGMSGRIIHMRKVLKDKLIEKGSKLNWDHLTDQIGMFSYTGLTKEQCLRLTNEFHIYLTLNGRISMCGLTSSNIDRFAEAVHQVTSSDSKL